MPRTRKQTKSAEKADSGCHSATLDDFERVEKELVISFGKFGRCNVSEDILCPQRFPTETLEIMNKVLCRECAKEIHGEDAVRGAKVNQSDATFRCPAYQSDGSCQSKEVKYRVFFTGSCCEPAARWLTKNEKGKIEKIKVVESLCNETIRNLRMMKEDSEMLSDEIEDEEEQVKRDEKKAEGLEKLIEESMKKILENKKEIGALKKRERELANDYDAASKRMNLLSFEYFNVAKKEKININQKTQNDEESNRCPVCLENYAKKGALQKSMIRCGHSACNGCLLSILGNEEVNNVYGNRARGAKCPKCRKFFKGEDIIRAYD